MSSARMHKFRTVEGNGGNMYTLFYGGCFSNFWICHNLKIGNQSFKCTEQYYMFRKALAFNDKEAAKQILKATKPAEMKAIGRKVKNFDADIWLKEAVPVMIRCNYMQNTYLLEELKKVAGTVMVEASPWDKIWGIGLGVNHPDATNCEKWRGRNLLGQILGAIRDCLISKEWSNEESVMDAVSAKLAHMSSPGHACSLLVTTEKTILENPTAVEKESTTVEIDTINTTGQNPTHDKENRNEPETVDDVIEIDKETSLESSCIPCTGVSNTNTSSISQQVKESRTNIEPASLCIPVTGASNTNTSSISQKVKESKTNIEPAKRSTDVAAHVSNASDMIQKNNENEEKVTKRKRQILEESVLIVKKKKNKTTKDNTVNEQSMENKTTTDDEDDSSRTTITLRDLQQKQVFGGVLRPISEAKIRELRALPLSQRMSLGDTVIVLLLPEATSLIDSEQVILIEGNHRFTAMLTMKDEESIKDLLFKCLVHYISVELFNMAKDFLFVLEEGTIPYGRVSTPPDELVILLETIHRREEHRTELGKFQLSEELGWTSTLVRSVVENADAGFQALSEEDFNGLIHRLKAKFGDQKKSMIWKMAFSHPDVFGALEEVQKVIAADTTSSKMSEFLADTRRMFFYLVKASWTDPQEVVKQLKKLAAKDITVPALRDQLHRITRDGRHYSTDSARRAQKNASKQYMKEKKADQGGENLIFNGIKDLKEMDWPTIVTRMNKANSWALECPLFTAADYLPFLKEVKCEKHIIKTGKKYFIIGCASDDMFGNGCPNLSFIQKPVHLDI